MIYLCALQSQQCNIWHFPRFYCTFVTMSFQSAITEWYCQHKRSLPWRESEDPYVIWLSEIILQQTRVEQGLPYFNKFFLAFPTVASFAAASEETVLKLWQGLGYYSRGRNMLYTAKHVMEHHEGIFPKAYTQLLNLKGVGTYTAAAISSFSNNELRAVVDGNVYRVLARYFGVYEEINKPKGQKIFAILANKLIADQRPSIYNQAIMEFGALQCKPKSPNCGICPLQIDCFAYTNNKVAELPQKVKKNKVKERWFNYFVGIKNNEVLTKQRKPGDIWQHLYDFPQIELDINQTIEGEYFIENVKALFGNDVEIRFLERKKHLLTHQIIYVQFFAIANYIVNFKLNTDIKSVEMSAFKALPHHKVIGDFIEKHLD